MDMADDTDEKIRRNLVAASAAVLLTTSLGIPFEVIVRRLLVGDATFVAPARLLAVLFGVLAYLLARYRFSDDGEHLIERLELEATHLTHSLIRLYGAWHAGRYVRTGRSSAVFSPTMESLVSDIAERNNLLAAGAVVRPRRIVIAHDGAISDWSVACSVGMEWDAPQLVSTAGGSRLTVSRSARKVINAVAWFGGCTYSKASITSLVPLWLAGLAIASLGWRLLGLYAAV
jgi:hypothetical protein